MTAPSPQDQQDPQDHLSADKPAGLPARRASPRTPATRSKARSKKSPAGLSSAPIDENEIPKAASDAGVYEVEIEKLRNERRRDRHQLVREVLVVLVLVTLMLIGAKFVTDGLLSAESYMGLFAAGCVGAVARDSVRRPRS